MFKGILGGIGVVVMLLLVVGNVNEHNYFSDLIELAKNLF